jgi:hypothetical protein
MQFGAGRLSELTESKTKVSENVRKRLINCFRGAEAFVKQFPATYGTRIYVTFSVPVTDLYAEPN